MCFPVLQIPSHSQWRGCTGWRKSTHHDPYKDKSRPAHRTGQSGTRLVLPGEIEDTRREVRAARFLFIRGYVSHTPLQKQSAPGLIVIIYVIPI